MRKRKKIKGEHDEAGTFKDVFGALPARHKVAHVREFRPHIVPSRRLADARLESQVWAWKRHLFGISRVPLTFFHKHRLQS